MNQLENCQAMYRSNTWMGRTSTDGPNEFEPSKFDCNRECMKFENFSDCIFTLVNVYVLCWY